MVAIQERIVASGHGYFSPTLFCVHSTANKGATAANHVSYWSNNPAYAVHLVSDWEEAYNTVDYAKMCWQVGNGNRYVEGLEICEATNREDFERGIDIAADVVAQRLRAHGWDTENLVTHAYCTERWGGSDHTDPLPYFKEWGYSWGEFVDLVQSKLNNESEDDDMQPWDLLDTQIAVQTDDGGQENQKVWSVMSWGTRYAKNAWQNTHAMKAQLAALSEAVKTLAENMGADPDEIAEKVSAAVQKKLESIDLEVKVND